MQEKVKITNDFLIKELNFSKIIKINTYFWGGRFSYSYIDEVLENFGKNVLALTNVYNKITGKNYFVKRDGYEIILNGKQVFYFYQSNNHTYKKQNLNTIKEMIKEILEKIDLETFKNMYNEELYRASSPLRIFRLHKIKRENIVKFLPEQLKVKKVIEKSEYGITDEIRDETFTISLEETKRKKFNLILDVEDEKMLDCKNCLLIDECDECYIIEIDEETAKKIIAQSIVEQL
jgi:hypothetical protein